MSLRDQLKALGKRVQPVDLEDGLRVFVRTMTVGELEALGQQVRTLSDETEQKYATIILYTLYCLCDEHGVRLYQDQDKAEVEQLPPAVLTAVFHAAHDHNRLDALVVAKKKPSETTPSTSG